MLLTDQHIHTIQLLLEEHEGITDSLKVNRIVSGGSINTCYQLKADKLYFLKINDAHKFPGMFRAESEGLNLIRETKTIQVPQVIAHEISGTEQFLLMHWVESGRNNAIAQEMLGRQLAMMHQHTSVQFGLDDHNYMGSLTQPNNFHSNWADFFIAERLEPQIKMGVQKGLINSSLNSDFQILFTRFDNLYPIEKPALIHGDLWSGNYMINTSGAPVLIDPAVAYAHREMDIAMSMLFGGFDPDFYRAYNEVFPLEKGWKQRLDLWNLYPLLVHLNLFGRGYLQQLKSCLGRYL